MTPARLPVVTALTPMPPPPQRVGTTITWTATATGGVAPLTYRFRRFSAATGLWTMVRDYSTSNTYSWTPALNEAGTYQIEVRVRNAGSTTGYDANLIGPSFTIMPW